MKDYIIRFERLYKKLEHNGMTLHDTLRAYRLMKSANLGKDELLAKVGMGSEPMTYARMKCTLLNMSEGIVQTNSQGNVTPKVKLIKEEPSEVLFQDENTSHWCNGGTKIYLNLFNCSIGTL